MKAAFSSNIYYRRSFQNPVLHIASASPASQIRAPAMLF